MATNGTPLRGFYAERIRSDHASRTAEEPLDPSFPRHTHRRCERAEAHPAGGDTARPRPPSRLPTLKPTAPPSRGAASPSPPYPRPAVQEDGGREAHSPPPLKCKRAGAGEPPYPRPAVQEGGGRGGRGLTAAQASPVRPTLLGAHRGAAGEGRRHSLARRVLWFLRDNPPSGRSGGRREREERAGDCSPTLLSPAPQPPRLPPGEESPWRRWTYAVVIASHSRTSGCARPLPPEWQGGTAYTDKRDDRGCDSLAQGPPVGGWRRAALFFTPPPTQPREEGRSDSPRVRRAEAKAGVTPQLGLRPRSSPGALAVRRTRGTE